MEDYTPQEYRNRGVGLQDYITIFTNLLRAVRFSAVSLTGGEPLVNHHLAEIAAEVRPLTQRLELNTNGLLMTEERWAALHSYFDRVKISVDSLDPKMFKLMTRAAGNNPLARVLNAIRIVRSTGTEVAVNTVVTRQNLHTVTDVIDWAGREGLRLHLLDFYYTEERRDVWQQNFLPIEEIIPMLNARYGKPTLEPIFGCTFYSYAIDGGGVVRLKTSYEGTMRSARCQTCPRFCQEGVYGLKLSTDGWITTCPSNEAIDGTLLEPVMSPAEVRKQIDWLVGDIESAEMMHNSFEHLMNANNLTIAPLEETVQKMLQGTRSNTVIPLVSAHPTNNVTSIAS